MSKMIEHATGVVLAGGKSSRMGKNKALLLFEGKALVERSVERLSSIFARVLLSVNQHDLFPDLHLLKIEDHYFETGPMGAIASVLESDEKRIFCVACDMPFLNQKFIEYMCAFDDHEAVIPVWNGRPEVLHSVYSVALLPAFQKALHQKQFRLIDAITKSNVRFIREEEIKQFDPKGISFKNVNTPEDYDELTDR